MKILWKSAHPELGSGYGQQTALVVPRLKALGHDMYLGLTFGQNYPGAWNGIPVFPTTADLDRLKAGGVH